MVPLGEIVSPAGSKAGEDTAHPVFSVTKHAGFVPSNEYFKKQVFSRELGGYKRVRPGNFAYATIHLDEGSIGIAPTDGLISPMYTVFQPITDRVDPFYLLRFMKSPAALAQYPKFGKGSVHRRKSISLDALGQLSIPLPPLAEQRRIAAILEQADSIKATRIRMVDELSQLRRSVFSTMFGDVSPTTTLGEHGAIQGGLQISRARAGHPLPVPYLRVANVHRGKLELTEVKYLNATTTELERTRLRAGDLLFVEGHANPHEVGRTAVWQEEIPNCVHQNHLIRVRPEPSRLDSQFAADWFNSAAGASHFRRASKTTSGLNTISAATIRSAPLLLPRLAEQLEYRASVDSIERRLQDAMRSLSQTDELIAALQARAFRGDL